MTTEVHAPSRNCYLRGCRNPECVHASTRYTKQLRLEHQRGQYRMTEATQARHHVERLVAAGWTQVQISEASQVPSVTINKLYAGAQEKIANWRAAAILAVHITPPPANPHRVDATGSRRRLQALRVIGHRRYDLAAQLDMTPDRVKHITSSRTQFVSPQEATAIARVYRRLSTLPGPSQQTASMARNNGWHGPLAWDDIDDPRAKPDVDEHADKRGRPAKIDELRVARLVREGLTNNEIANRLDCHVRTVTRARARITTNDLKEAA